MRRKLDIVHVQADIVVGDDVSDPPDADHGMQMHPDGAQYFVDNSRYLFFCPPLSGIMIRTDWTIQNKEDIQSVLL